MKKAVFREKNRLFAPLNCIGLCNAPPSIGLRRGQMGPFPGGNPSVGMKVIGIYWDFIARLHLRFDVDKKMEDYGCAV